MERSDTDDFWIKIEILQWVLFVIFAIRNGSQERSGVNRDIKGFGKTFWS